MAARIAQLRDALRRLADWPATDLPVISAYLDLRPGSAGDNPQVRSGLVVVRDRLREIESELEPRTPAHDSLTADIERIDDYIENEALPAARCLALFACHGLGERFEVLHTSVGLEDQVVSGGRPRLLQLARLGDEDQALVALADTNTLRLFALRSGALEEIGLLDDQADDYSQPSGGGWSQNRFQRHVQEHRQAFAELAAGAIDKVAQQEQARVLVLAGDEVALPLLTDALPQHLAERTRGSLRIDMRATPEEVEEEALAFLQTVHAADAEEAADRLVGAHRSAGLGVAGLDDTLQALRLGQVDEMLIDSSAEFDAESIEEAIGLAATTDARIRFCTDHGGLRKLGGVGALLRFRLDGPVSDPQSVDRAEGAPVSGQAL
ncbi:hypothetical protein BH24CHL6_BH24CHL6_07110 [soil metagenome]